MNAREFMKKYLEENGYDGLCQSEVDCGCGKDDLFPCGVIEWMCKPAYIRYCKDCDMENCELREEFGHCYTEYKFEEEREMNEFEKELACLINKYSIENSCDIPDFLLARMISNYIQYVASITKEILDWHGCDSVCHPNPRQSNDGFGREIPGELRRSEK